LLCLLVLLPAATSSASETYTITAAELRQLEGNLTRLQQINDSLTQALGEQRNKAVDLQTALTEAQEQLTEARRRQTALQVELANLKDLSKMQAESLEKANKSFEMFAKEEKARRVRIKAQRNAWEAVAACALIAFVAK
jgi:chromosome segregation ATPase